jgi:CarD family transcriptional regulator
VKPEGGGIAPSGRTREDIITDMIEEHLDEEVELEDLIIEPLPQIDFEVGDSVVYPHHGAGRVLKKEMKDVLGEKREYLTIKILHNDMTVMVPTANAAVAGLRRVVDEETLQKVMAVLQDQCSDMPKNWNRRFKHNRDKIKTGDIYELAEVVRNLAIREHQKGLSTGEKQMFTRAKKILASELMYALEMDEEQVDAHLSELLLTSSTHPSAAGAETADDDEAEDKVALAAE